MTSGKRKNKILKFIFKKGYKATRYPFLVGIFLMQLILSNQTANAQSISLDQEWRTDLMRREQLLGRFDSSISFVLNPIYLSSKELKSNGVNIVERQFNKEYKEKIYTELSQLIREERIDIYDLSGGAYLDSVGNKIPLNEIQEAKTQFLFLQKKWKGKRYYIESLSGYKDDICDAVAAVSYECLTSRIQSRLPSSKFVSIGRFK